MGKINEAMDLFNTLFAEGLVPNAVTYSIMLEGPFKAGLLDEVHELFLSMEKYNCSPISIMLNSVVRGLLEKENLPTQEK